MWILAVNIVLWLIGIHLPNTSSMILPLNKDCGRSFSRLHRRIVGGSTSSECEFPWTVMVQIGEVHCGGSLIDHKHVLTAAHCLEGPEVTPETEVSVMGGSIQRDRMKKFKVQSWILHPNRNISLAAYDIAVLRLDHRVDYDECLYPVCLPASYENLSGDEECWAAGWGKDLIHDRISLQKKVLLPLVDRLTCKSVYKELMDETKLCAGDFIHGGIDTCQGDSGGPLMCRSPSDQYIQYGLVSFGNGCGVPFNPGVYTRVDHPNILNFIIRTLEDV